MSGKKKISRREFLRGAAVTGAAVATSGVLNSIAPTAAQAAGVPDKWDKEVDVVVVGTGTAFTGALAAAEAGATVLMLEKGEKFGGTTAISGGGIWIPNNYVMKQEGSADSRDDAITYMKRLAEGQAPDDLIAQYVDKSVEMINWLKDKIGFQFQRAGESFADYYPNFPGGKPAKDRRQINILRQDKVGGGKGLMTSAQEAVTARKIEVMLKTPGKQLITNDKGEVIGIIASSNGKDINIKARKGVILGTGGFDFNKDMVLHFLRTPLYFSNAVPENTGDGHLMGMALGADLRNMNECWGLPGYVYKEGSYVGEADWQLYRGKPGAIIVNKYGERFGNEAASYDPFLRAFQAYDTGKFEWRNIPGYTLFDSGYTKNYALPGAGYAVGKVPDTIKKADTIDDLAKALGINVDGLKTTLARFNANAKNGVDPDWHRGESDFDIVTAGDRKRTDLKNAALAPLETPPFYGVAIWPGTCGTNGGLRTDVNGQVINVWGKVIPGLYASGNTMASVFGTGYAGGGATVGQGMTFAYLAGKHAASVTPRI